MQRALLLLLLVLLLPVSPVSADPIPIVIRAGSAVVTPADGGNLVDIDVRGSRGFALRQQGDAQTFGCGPPCLPPGSHKDFGGCCLDNEGGTAELAGRSFVLAPNFFMEPGNADAGIRFFAPATLPPPSPEALLFVPFHIEGFFRFTSPGFSGDLPLVGQGTATIHLRLDAVNQLWEFTGSRFDFEVAPTPEPATLLLFGSGLAGAAWNRRRSRVWTSMH